MTVKPNSSRVIQMPRSFFYAAVIIVSAAVILMLLDGRPRTDPRRASPFFLSLTEQSIVDGALGRTTERSVEFLDNSPNLSHSRVMYSFDADDDDLQLSQDIVRPVMNAFTAIDNERGTARIGHMFQPSYGKTYSAARGRFETKHTEGVIAVTVTRDRYQLDRKDSNITIIIELFEVDR